MSAPFDTLKLARGFEAAGFPLDQASKMAEAVAQATIGADLATKTDLAPLATKTGRAPLATKVDLAELKAGLVKWVAGMLVVVVVLTLTGVGIATAILFKTAITAITLNRLSATPISTPAPRASITLAAAERPYSCRLLDDEQKKCAFGSCDVRTVDRLRKECLRDGGRP